MGTLTRRWLKSTSSPSLSSETRKQSNGPFVTLLAVKCSSPIGGTICMKYLQFGVDGWILSMLHPVDRRLCKPSGCFAVNTARVSVSGVLHLANLGAGARRLSLVAWPVSDRGSRGWPILGVETYVVLRMLRCTRRQIRNGQHPGCGQLDHLEENLPHRDPSPVS